MVRIVDGEIVQDDDPRVTGQSNRATSAPSPGQRIGPPGIGIDWNAPPFRTVPAQLDFLGLGLPDVEIFGVRVTSMQLIVAFVVWLLFGWRSLVFLAIMYAFWMWSLRAMQQESTQEGLSNMINRYMSNNPNERRQEPPRRQDSQQGESFTGRAFKLNND